MDLPKNLGGTDRIVRGVAGVWLVAAAISAFLDDREKTAAMLGIAGSGLLLNAKTQFCGCNALLGVDTTANESDSDPVETA